jgi:hypothetical protein
LQAAQPKVPALADDAGDFEGLRGGTHAGAMIANVEVDQKVDGAGGGFVPFDLPHVVDNRHRASGRDARDFPGITQRRRQQDARNRILGHQLSFGDCGDGNSTRSVLDLPLGDLDAFVRLGVRSELLARLLHRLRHAPKIGFEEFGVEE